MKITTITSIFCSVKTLACLLLMNVVFLTMSTFSFSQTATNLNCISSTPAVAETEYGVEHWNAFVYTFTATGQSTGLAGPIATEAFKSSNYKGHFTANEMFDVSWSFNQTNCILINEYYSIRYRMKKDFPCGKYKFKVVGDDGIRLSLDGGVSWVYSYWQNGNSSFTTPFIELSGVKDLVIEYYQSYGGSRVAFSYETEKNLDVVACVNSAMTPIDYTMTGATAITSATGLPSGVLASVEGGVVKLSGTPTVAGTYNYKMILSPCGVLTGKLVVNSATSQPTATSPQPICVAGTVANLTTISGTSIKWYDVSSGGTPLPGATALSQTTYYVSQTINGCESSRKPVAVTFVSMPSASLSTPNATICHGNAVPLGGTVNATGAWTVTLSNGTSTAATATGSGPGSWTAQVTPTTTTTYTISSIVNSVCTTTGTGSTIVTLPTKGTSLGVNGEEATCRVKGANKVDFYHLTSGHYLGSVSGNNVNSDLGDVTIKLNVVGTTSSTYACSQPSNEAYRTAYMGRNWIFTSTNYVGTNFDAAAKVRLPFLTSELEAMNLHASTVTVGNPFDNDALISDLMLTKFTGTTANPEDFIPTNNCTGGVTRKITQLSSGTITGASYADFSVLQFSEMYLNKSTTYGALPVVMKHFTANCDNNVKLSWTTASEQNSDRFIVESSTDLETWNWVDEVLGAGNSNTFTDYEVNDRKQRVGISYYRLIQVDIDGQENVYGPISVDCGEFSEHLSVFPNPSSGNFTVEVASNQVETNVTISLIDLTGKTIETRTLNLQEGSNQLVFDVNHIANGSYLLRMDATSARFQPVKLVIEN